MSTPADQTLDRMLRHMAWANQAVLSALGQLNAEQLTWREPGSDVSVAEIAEHLVTAQRWYVWRLAESAYEVKDPPVPKQPSEFAELARLMAEADAQIRAAAALPDAQTRPYQRGDNEVVTRARSTIIAQAIHHATEHRAQIADSLAANGLKLIDLDELDLWAYGSFEGLGA